MNDKKGVILLTGLIVMFFLSSVGLVLFSLVYTRFLSSNLYADMVKAQYFAESGISASLRELKMGTDSADDGIGDIDRTALGGGFFEARHDFRNRTIIATGISNGVKRTIQIKYASL